jgi:hypothetical protein
MSAGGWGGRRDTGTRGCGDARTWRQPQSVVRRSSRR